MPTLTASYVIDRAEIILQDTTNVRWPQSELLGWLNDGQREIVTLRPDTFVQRSVVTLVTGTRQTLPADGYQLVNLTRNMGVGGATPGKALRKVEQALLDSQVPDWHSSTPSTTILHYTYDQRDPLNFYVYPPATAGATLEMIYSKAPPDLATVGSTLSVPDIYANALIDYILFRAYSKDAAEIGNAERAKAARASFENTLGLKAQADAAAAPKSNPVG